MAAKKVTKQFKIMAPGGKATPGSSDRSRAGANGVNPGQFITQFNERTKEFQGRVVGCLITVYSDRSFEFEIKTLSGVGAHHQRLKIEKGSGTPNTTKVGKLTKAQLKKIAEEKLKDLNTTSVEAAMRTIAGTARSMGVTIEE